MDQIKEFLNLALKYRFWIAIGVATLLPLIGYFLTAGSLQEEETRATTGIKSDFEAVKKYSSNPTPVNKEYQPLVKQETSILKRDVDTAWRKLYERQEPLLTWPEDVSKDFTTWGRAWPKELAPNVVRDTIMSYIETYEPYWRDVYKTFKPFDSETGEGIVAAPPAEVLLRPAGFDVNKPPTLGKVWNAQEKLWVQRTVLEVIAKVNEKAGAKDWLSATIKQILELEVANDKALDEKSVAQGTEFAELEEIEDPNAAPRAEEGAGGTANDLMAAMGGRGPGSAGAMGGGMGGTGGKLGEPDVVKYITDAKATQVYIAPIYLKVYCEQSAIPNLITEFSNSPMNIQVKQVSIFKPSPNSVKRPKKGDKVLGMGGDGFGMMGDMMSGGYGGMSPMSMSKMMGGSGTSGGYGADMGGAYGAAGKGGMSGGYGTGGYGGAGMAGNQGAATKKQGVDVSQETLKKLKESKEKSKESEKTTETDPEDDPSAPDPYFDIVEVRIWGHARFYKMPPAPEESASESDSPQPDASEEPTPAAVGGSAGVVSSSEDDTATASETEAEAGSDEAKSEEPAVDEMGETSEPESTADPEMPSEDKEPASDGPGSDSSDTEPSPKEDSLPGNDPKTPAEKPKTEAPSEAPGNPPGGSASGRSDGNTI